MSTSIVTGIKIGVVLEGLGTLGSAINSTDRLGQSIAKLKNQRLNIGKEFGFASEQAKKLRDEIVHLSKKQKMLNWNLNMSDKLQNYRNMFRSNIMDKIALGATISAPLKVAVDFEKASIESSKYLNMSAVEQKVLDRNILNLSTKMPSSAVDLYGIATAGGQLGIAKKDILSFTEGVGKISLAFGITADEAGDSVAKMINVFGISTKQAMLTADAINHITDSVEGNTAKAGELLNVTQRVGGMAHLLKMSAVDTAALGSAFLSTGQTAEVSATSINALLLRLGDPEGQNKDFQAGLEKIGLSAKGLKAAVDKDATGAIMMFLNQIKKLPKNEQLGALNLLFGAEHADNIAQVAGNTKVLEASLKAVSDQSKYTGSAQREFERQMASTDSQLKILKNTIFKVGIIFGSIFLPAVNKIVKGFQWMGEKLSALINKYPTLSKVVGGAIVGIASLSLVASGLGYIFSFLGSGILKTIRVVSFLRNPMRMLGAATCSAGDCASSAASKFGVLRGVMSGLGAIGFAQIAGIAALGAALAGVGIVAGSGTTGHLTHLKDKNEIKAAAKNLDERMIAKQQGWSTWQGWRENLLHNDTIDSLRNKKVLLNRKLGIKDKKSTPAVQNNNNTYQTTIHVHNPKSDVDVQKAVNKALKNNSQKQANLTLKGGK